MAINPKQREDLMREATAYIRRALIRDAQTGESIFVGLRQNGGWSIYFGEDPVIQFDAQSRLRRLHFENQNYAANNGKLCLLQREQRGGRVEIQRIYSADAERRVLEDCHKRLRELAESMLRNAIEVVDRFPVDDLKLIADMAESIGRTAHDIQIASSANA